MCSLLTLVCFSVAGGIDSFMVNERISTIHALYPRADKYVPKRKEDDELPSTKLQALVSEVLRIQSDPATKDDFIAIYSTFTKKKDIVHQVGGFHSCDEVDANCWIM